MSNLNMLASTVRSKLSTGFLVLPTLPEIAIKVLRAFDNDLATAHQIANILIQDPSMSLRILKISNSALLSSPVRITDLKAAVIRIGIGRIKNIVSAIALEQVFVGRHSKNKTLIRGLYKESCDIACMALSLHYHSRYSNACSSDDLMLHGMISNIGYLPIIAEADASGIEDLDLSMINPSLVKTLTKAVLKSWDMDTIFSEEAVKAVEHDPSWSVSPATFIAASKAALKNLPDEYSALLLEEGLTLSSPEIKTFAHSMKEIFE